MQLSQQHPWLGQLRPTSWQAVRPLVPNKRSHSKPFIGSLCINLLGCNRSYEFAGHTDLCRRSLHSKERHANPVGLRRIVTRASGSPTFASESSLWEWRKVQLHKIAMFAGPALSIPLADPIMSLVDTVCVGQVNWQRSLLTYPNWSMALEGAARVLLWLAVHWDIGTCSPGSYNVDLQPLHIRVHGNYPHYCQV